MSDHTHIQWTDATWNPITGCSVVSAGCRHCYAMRLAGGRLRHHPSRAGLTRETSAGPVWTGEVRLNEGWLDQPLRWRNPRRIFVCAHGDLFHPAVPDEWIDRVFAVMALAPQHTFQVLTKRPGRMLDWFRRTPYTRILRQADILRAARPNLCSVGISDPTRTPWSWVWLGVSVEDQPTADERIPLLLQTPAAVRFISAEPLLGPVNLRRWTLAEHGRRHIGAQHGIRWVIVGGESGPRARPCGVGWVRSIVEQCRAAAVPCFVKQFGASPVEEGCEPGHVWVGRAPQSLRRLADRAGSDPAEWPADLRVREFPGDAPGGGR